MGTSADDELRDILHEKCELAAKICANLSFVSLNLGRLEEAVEHGKAAVSTAPSWGKACARLGAAQQSNGFLLDAAAPYKSALTAKDKFTGCRKACNDLSKSLDVIASLLLSVRLSSTRSTPNILSMRRLMP